MPFIAAVFLFSRGLAILAFSQDNHLPAWPPLPVMALLAVSVFINYIDRSNLSIAAPLLKDELSLSASRLGILLSASFWTYAGCQLLAGWLVDRFDVKYVFAIGFFLWSAATSATGLFHGFAALVAVRVILGAGENALALAGLSSHCQAGISARRSDAGVYPRPCTQRPCRR